MPGRAWLFIALGSNVKYLCFPTGVAIILWFRSTLVHRTINGDVRYLAPKFITPRTAAAVLCLRGVLLSVGLVDDLFLAFEFRPFPPGARWT